MYRISLNNARKSRLQTYFLILGIMFTVGLETGILVTVDTLYTDVVLDNRNQNYTDIIVTPDRWKNIETLNNLSNDIRNLPGVEKASPTYHVSLERFEEELNISKKVLVYGIDPFTHPDWELLKVVKGNLDIRNNSVIISEAVQQGLQISLGENITLNQVSGIGFEGANVTVQGIISDETYFANKFGNAFIITNIISLYSIFDPFYRSKTLIGEVDVKVGDLAELNNVAIDVRDLLGINFYVSVEKTISNLQVLGLRTYQSVLYLIVFIALIVEILFISNILGIAIENRKHELGLLLSMGVGKIGLIKLIIYELLIYSIIGSLLGLIIGIGLSSTLITILDFYYRSLTLEGLIITVEAIGTSFFTGIIISLISGLYPIFLVIRIPVIRSIYPNIQKKRISFKSILGILTSSALILIVLGYFSIQSIEQNQTINLNLFSQNLVGIIVFFLGILLLEMLLVLMLPRVGNNILFFVNKPIRLISMRLVSKNFIKTLFTFLAISIALTSLIIVNVVSSGVIESVPEYYTDELGSLDLIIESNDAESLSISETIEIAQKPEIKVLSYIQETRAEINGFPGFVYGVVPKNYEHFQENAYFKDSSGNLSDLLAFNATLLAQRNNTIITSTINQRLGLKIGEFVQILTPNNETKGVRVAAIIQANPFLGNGEYIYLSASFWQSLFNSSNVKYVLSELSENSTNIERLENDLKKDYPQIVNVWGINLFTGSIENSLRFQTTLFQVLILETLILAGLAQFIYMQISTRSSEKDIGLLRTMGVSKNQSFNIFFIQALTIGSIAIGTGLLNGLFGAIFVQSIISGYIPLKFVLPSLNVVVIIIAVLFIILVSTYRPAKRVSRQNVVNVLADRPERDDEIYRVEKREKYLLPWFLQWYTIIITGAFYIFIVVIFIFIFIFAFNFL